MEYLCTVNITTEDKLANKNFITTLRDLNIIVADNKANHRVVLRKDFIDTYFPYDQLSEYVNMVGRINPHIIIESPEYEIGETLNTDMLDLLRDNMDKDELQLLLNFKHYDFIETLYKLIKFYDEHKDFELQGASIISGLRETIDRLNDQLADTHDVLAKEIHNKVDYMNRLSVLVNRINYSHNVGIDENMLFRAKGNSYDKVIYIKEITRVQYVDTLIYTLQEILKLLYSMPTRIVVIEGYYATGKVSQYPNLQPHYSLTERDVLLSDILMLGFQPKTFTDIMRNPSNISILIVLDRGGYVSPHLFGDNVEYLFTASDLNDIQDVTIPPSRVISYHEDTLFIPHIKNFNSLSMSEKVQKYSTLNIVKRIVDLLE